MTEKAKLCNAEGGVCLGLKYLLEQGAIRTAAGIALSADGERKGYSYHWLGPRKNPSKGMFVVFCPCCGGRVAKTAQFMAEFTKEEAPNV